MGFELDGILLYIYLYYSLSLRYTALLDAFAERGISESWTNQIIKSIYICIYIYIHIYIYIYIYVYLIKYWEK